MRLPQVNNHSGVIWKDYYLENWPRLDPLVEARRRTSSSNKGKEKQTKSASPPPNRSAGRSSRKERRRVYSGPSPPKRVEQMSDGKFKFTKEDYDFMLNYLRWRVSQNFTRSKTKLGKELHKRVRIPESFLVYIVCLSISPRLLIIHYRLGLTTCANTSVKWRRSLIRLRGPITKKAEYMRVLLTRMR